MHIVITGASKGIGKAIAERFARDEAHTLYLCARNKEPLEHLKKTLATSFPGTTVYTMICDVAQKEDLQHFAEWVLGQAPVVDVLINNAGMFVPGSIYNEEEGVLEKMLQVNLLSAYHLTRYFIPRFIEQKAGQIFNICSIASFTAYPNGGSYSISKYALAGFTKNLREELKPFGIKVSGVYPGATYTDSWSLSDVEPARIMEAEDVAGMIYAAASLSSAAVMEDIILRPQLGDL